jgi:hypothetical protein
MVFDPDGTDQALAEQVLEWSTKATELEPDFPYWWMRLGLRQMVIEGPAAARLSFERALDLQPYHPLSLQMLGVIANATGDEDLASLVNRRLTELGYTSDDGQPSDG